MHLMLDAMCFMLDLVLEWSTKFFKVFLPAITDWWDRRELDYCWGSQEAKVMISKRRRGWIYFFPVNSRSEFCLYRAEIHHQFVNHRLYRHSWFNQGFKLLPSEERDFYMELAKSDVYIYDLDLCYGMTANEKSFLYDQSN